MSNKTFKKPQVVAMNHSSFNSRFVHKQEMDDLIASRMLPAGKMYKESVADTVRPVVDNENRKRYKTQGQDNLSKDPYEEFKLYEQEKQLSGPSSQRGSERKGRDFGSSTSVPHYPSNSKVSNELNIIKEQLSPVDSPKDMRRYRD